MNIQEPVVEFKGHTAEIECVIFSHDNKFIISGSQDQSVRIWDLSSGAPFSTLQGHNDWIKALQLTSDGKCLVSASSKDVIVWNLEKDSWSQVIAMEPNKWITTMTFTSDFKEILLGTGEGSIEVWDLNKKSLIQTIQAHKKRVNSLILTSNDENFISGGEDEPLKLWNLKTGDLVRVYIDDTEPDKIIMKKPMGMSIQMASQYRNAIKYERQEIYRTTCAAINGDGSLLVNGCKEGTIYWWEIQTGRMLRKYTSKRSKDLSILGGLMGDDLMSSQVEARSIAVSSDSNIAFSGQIYGLKITEINQGTTYDAKQNEGGGTCLALSPDDKFLVIGGYDKTLRVFRVGQ